MYDANNQNSITLDLEYDPIFAHSQAPVSLQRSLQRLGELFRLDCQAFFDCLSDDYLVSFVDLFQVMLLNVGMIF